MWLPALGAALFIGAAVWLFGTDRSAELAAKQAPTAGDLDAQPPPPAGAVPTDSAHRRPNGKQMEEQLKILQERFRNRGAPPSQAPPH
jgi:hypothetical protein